MKTYTLGEFAEWLLNNPENPDVRVVKVEDVKDLCDKITNLFRNNGYSEGFAIKWIITPINKLVNNELSQSNSIGTQSDVPKEVSNPDETVKGNSYSSATLDKSGRDTLYDNRPTPILKGNSAERFRRLTGL